MNVAVLKALIFDIQAKALRHENLPAVVSRSGNGGLITGEREDWR